MSKQEDQSLPISSSQFKYKFETVNPKLYPSLSPQPVSKVKISNIPIDKSDDSQSINRSINIHGSNASHEVGKSTMYQKNLEEQTKQYIKSRLRSMNFPHQVNQGHGKLQVNYTLDVPLSVLFSKLSQ